VAIFRRVQNFILLIARSFLSIFPRGFHPRDRIFKAHVFDFGHMIHKVTGYHYIMGVVTVGDEPQARRAWDKANICCLMG
jgi:nitroreductase